MNSEGYDFLNEQGTNCGVSVSILESDYQGMRVNLMSDMERLDFLLLPKVVEGRYTFYSKNATISKPLLSVDAKNGEWYVTCNAQMRLWNDSAAIGSSFVLAPDTLYVLTNGRARFILYAEVLTKQTIFKNYFVLGTSTQLTIGRDNTCDIMCSGRFVGREHATMTYSEASGWQIVDSRSKNGTYVNGRRVASCELKLGDSIYIMGLHILVGTSFLSICGGMHTLRINRQRLCHLGLGERTECKSNNPVVQKLFNRIPRSMLSMEWQDIEIDAPPMPMASNKMPLVLRFGSSAIMGGRSILTGSYSMALTSLVFPFLTQRYTDKERKEYEERRTLKYSEYLKKKQLQIAEECDHERKTLNENYPNLDTMLQHVSDGHRLWERRNTDRDFLCIRVGTGTMRMQAQVSAPTQRFEMEPDILETKMYQTAEREYAVPQAPVMLSLQENFVCGVVGDKSARFDFVRNMVAQLVATHSYDEVKIVFLLEKNDLENFSFVRYLPHIWDNMRTIRFLATDLPSANTIGEYLRKETEEALGVQSDYRKYKKTHPSYVIFSLGKRLFDGLEILKDVLFQEEYRGISIVAAFNELPKECSCIFQMNAAPGDHRLIDLLHPEAKRKKFGLDHCDEKLLANEMKLIANTNLLVVSGEFNLPKTITFLEMFGVGRIEHLNLLGRWKENDPTKSLATPIGVGTGGELFTLDLHEKRQGPHGLVAGMTGSGKSEFIITYILSMAVNFDPNEVAFLLIDYKGGGLAGAFDDPERGIHLPHLVGTITNLDGAAVTRSMISIESELRRRQRIFNEAKSACNEGTMDIYTYQRLYRAKRVSEPLPHLFVISDEFAELKSQQPEFMDKLISTARIGRSLGVHLILATQKPSGVVNDQIWSNTKFRVCLRVQDRVDSLDMLKRPEAAELKDTGRFYLQVGYNEYFALGQSAWCGADYIPQDEIVKQRDESVQAIDDAAQILVQAKPKVNVKASDEKQIVALVRYISALAQREHITTRMLLPPPLPKILTLEEVHQRFDVQKRESITALLGMIDDPENQAQYAYELDLQSANHLMIVGDSGCGKTTLIRTLLCSLINDYSPEDVSFYILDFSSHLLNVFRPAPHCGAVLTDANATDIPRLLTMIGEEKDRRKKLFAQSEVSGFNAYRKISSLPLIFVVIDGLSALAGLPKGSDYVNVICDFIRDSAVYGIQFIISGTHFNQFNMHLRQEMKKRIGMSLKDRYEYIDVLGMRTSYTPPSAVGRGLCAWDGRPLEFQAAVFSKTEDQQEQLHELKQFVAQSAERYASFAAAAQLPSLPENEEYADFCAKFGTQRIPLGYAVQDIRPIALPLKQLYSLSLYFGNPVGAAPIMENFLYAYMREGMEVVVVKRNAGGIFAHPGEQLSAWIREGKVIVLENNAENAEALHTRLINEVSVRRAYQKEYCQLNYLDITDTENTANSFDHVHAHTKPFMVFFESFRDFALQLSAEQKSKFMLLFAAKNSQDVSTSRDAAMRRGRGYNLYYTACFAPGDCEALKSEVTYQFFNPQKYTLLFGGQFDKQTLAVLPKVYQSVTKVAPQYNNGVMYYNDASYGISMPCGELLQVKEKEEDRNIFGA